MARSVRLLLCCLLSLAPLAAAQAGDPRQGEPILPIPPGHGQDAAKAALGERLFHDPRLSADNSISCASCHKLDLGGTDRRAGSVGIGGALGPIKAPTVYNSGFNLVQFWDGRAQSLEEQAAGPVHNPLEMGSNWGQVLAKLESDPDLATRFAASYPEGISSANIQDAIATYERTLITPGSPFDRWLDGEAGALTPEQERGYALFKSYGCVACHQGVNVGGNMYQYMGAMGEYFADRGGELRPADLGRFNVTADPEDRHLFKVPSLRLAALNPPYFHDGTAETLEEAILAMARYQLGRSMPATDALEIAAFVGSLVGRHASLKP
jgi:cytochrome c peroxidase